MCNGVVYVDDVTLLFKGSASFLSEPGLCEQLESAALLFAPHLFLLPKKGSSPVLGLWHQTLSLCHTSLLPLCVSPFLSLLPPTFSCPLRPFCLSCLLSVWPLSTHPPTPPSLQISLSQFLSSLLSPHPTCLTPSCHWGSQRPLSLCSLHSTLWFPLSSRFSLRFSPPCFVSLAVLSDFSLCPSVHLSLCVSVFLFSYISPSPSVCLSGVCHRHAHFTSKQFYPVPLNWGYSISLCYFPGRNIYPDAVFQRWQERWLMQVHLRLPMCTQLKCIANKQWASPLPKGLGRAFWLIYDQLDNWGDSQKHQYVLNRENPPNLPLLIPCKKVGNPCVQ